eukprot:494296_1
MSVNGFLLLLVVVCVPHASTMSCSYAQLNQVRYPLETCVDRGDGTSMMIFCSTLLEVEVDEWTSSSICNGTPTPVNVEDTTYTNSTCSDGCEATDDRAILIAGSLLPPAMNPTDKPSAQPTVKPSVSPTNKPSISPTDMPSDSPTTAHPTKSPVTQNPTVNGETRYPSIFPTKHPTQTPTIRPTQTHTDSPTFNSQTAQADQTSDELNTNPQHVHAPFVSPSLPVHAICLLISLALCIASVYHLWFKKHALNKKQIVWTVKMFVFLTFTSNIIGIVCIMMVSIIMSTNAWTTESRNMALVPYYGISIAYCCGKFSLECFFLFRVYTAFRKSTVYALSTTLCVVLICCMFIVSFMWCFMFLDFGLHRVDVPYSMFILVSMLEVLLIVVLLYLFLKRLSGLILRHSLTPVSEPTSTTRKPSAASTDVKTASPHRSTMALPSHVLKPSISEAPSSTPRKRTATLEVTESEMQSHLSSKQTKWIFLITRCLLLSSIALITTILFGFFAFYSSQFHTIDIFVVYALWSVDMTTNSVCLYLNFIFADTVYNKSCHLCHRLCQKIVEYVAVKKMFKKYANDIKNLEHSQKDSVDV